MAYATPDELAAALRIKATPANTPALQSCLDAAAAEIDDELAPELVVDPAPALVARTNINRAVEWWKATDAAYGIIGIDDIGQLRIPKDGFARHAAVLTSLKASYGLA